MADPLDDPEFLLWHFEQNSIYARSNKLVVPAEYWEKYATTLRKALARHEPEPYNVDGTALDPTT